ncbi:caspase-14-like isoform X2 [Ursus americanus]|uniref:caspase-14-like isoform X2 n=1 Tax=Ursus arctos TaxID=9644 RepID=UPI001CF89929|nr:caspase-14-like isoform X2 [Ursus arctos]XP_045640378.1 caspase-14-like isoform X2 [Ursus americanus]
MAFLVAGTLQVASKMADARQSLERKGKYGLQGPRVALTLCSPEVSASTVAVLEGVFRTLGFESCQRREASVQGFLGELAGFREQLDALGGPVGCALVALVAPRGQLRQPQQLVQELSHCRALWGCPKVFLLLSSAPGAASEPGAFLTVLSELCGRFPHWSLLQLLTELEPSPSTQYDLSGTRAALLLSVVHDRPGAQHDVEALGGLCRALSFKTTLRTDPTAQAFQEEMAQFRECLDARRAPVSCALVALMAHGGPQGQLLGADGQEVQPEALVQELSHCRALWGCPKIFLLQACRGGQRDAGVGPTALPWFRRWLRASPTTPSHADVLQIYADAQGSSSAGPAPGSPDQADVLMVYAAAEGCVAYRDEEKGSDFIQTLVEVLRADPGAELLELLTEVNRRVCELEVLGPDCQERVKACLEIRSSLRRQLCLQA